MRSALLLCMLLWGGFVCAEEERTGWSFGGAVRFNYHQNDYTAGYGGRGKLDFDTARINVDYRDGAFVASAEYRYYRSRAAKDGRFVQRFGGDSEDTHFLRHAWLGWRAGGDEFQAGLNKMPFGALPFASHSYFFQLPYYAGLEDAYNLGLKYEASRGDWRAHLAFYLRPGPDGHGQSKDSARYTYNVVETDASGNRERNTAVARLARVVRHGAQASTEIGLSVLAGEVPDRLSDKTGRRWAAALHAQGNYGRWGLKLEAIRYRYRLKSAEDKVVTMGAYDAPYEVAAAGTFLVAGLSYRLPVNRGPLETVTLYFDWSMLHKDTGRFPHSRQNLIGAAWTLGNWLVYTDLGFGKHHPFLGPDYGTALGRGGNDEWHRRFNINIGFYF
ncbi:MAG: hypothetical protein DIU74_001385 [Pseudomonadota bacterium]